MQTRDLAALRARLAGGQTGGVNPPEGAEKITPALIEPRTQETAGGGAEPIAASTTTPVVARPADSDVLAAPTRGQKAAATRAANKARMVRAPAEAAVASPTTSTALDSVASAPPSASDLGRIAAALERIAALLDWNPDVVKTSPLEELARNSRRL